MRLITGGSGFLGVELSRLLEEKGFAVRVFDVNKSPRLSGNVEFIKGDIRDQRAVADACAGVSHVYHLVALLPQSNAPAPIMRAVHINGAMNMLEACVEHKVRRIVVLSSTEVYGRMRVIPCPEDAPRNPIGEYGRNKAACEDLCKKYEREKGLKIAILRPPTLIGPGIPEKGINMMMKEIRRGGFLPVIGDGGNRMQSLDVRDCARAVFLCGEEPAAAGEVFNARCEDVPTILDMVRRMKRLSDAHVKIVKIPAPIGINILRLLNAFGVSPVQPEHYELMLYDFISDITKIKTMLGWAPRISYAKSAADMYEWFLKEA